MTRQANLRLVTTCAAKLEGACVATMQGCIPNGERQQHNALLSLAGIPVVRMMGARRNKVQGAGGGGGQSVGDGKNV